MNQHLDRSETCRGRLGLRSQCDSVILTPSATTVVPDVATRRALVAVSGLVNPFPKSMSGPLTTPPVAIRRLRGKRVGQHRSVLQRHDIAEAGATALLGRLLPT